MYRYYFAIPWYFYILFILYWEFMLMIFMNYVDKPVNFHHTRWYLNVLFCFWFKVKDISKWISADSIYSENSEYPWLVWNCGQICEVLSCGQNKFWAVHSLIIFFCVPPNSAYGSFFSLVFFFANFYLIFIVLFIEDFVR